MNPTTIPTAALTNTPAHSDPSVPSNKRPSEITVDPGTSKRPKPSSNQTPSSNPRTPDQPTVLPNPNYSGDSILSGASNESADEELSRSFLKAFVDATLACLEDDFMELRWSKSGTMRIGRWVNPQFQLDVDQFSFHTMHFNLGVETITTKNDGGFHIMKHDTRWQDWTHGRRTP